MKAEEEATFGPDDLEGLVAVANSRPEIVAEIAVAPEACRDIALPRLAALRNSSEFREAVDGHLADDAPGRVDTVLARIDAMLAEG